MMTPKVCTVDAINLNADHVSHSIKWTIMRQIITTSVARSLEMISQSEICVIVLIGEGKHESKHEEVF
jgi:hypothetical protein